MLPELALSSPEAAHGYSTQRNRQLSTNNTATPCYIIIIIIIFLFTFRKLFTICNNTDSTAIRIYLKNQSFYLKQDCLYQSQKQLNETRQPTSTRIITLLHIYPMMAYLYNCCAVCTRSSSKAQHEHKPLLQAHH